MKILLTLCLATACAVSLVACSQQASDAGTSSQAPSQIDQQGQRANFSNLLTLTGKSTTITVSDAGVLKKQEMPSGGGWNRTGSGVPSGGSASSHGTNRGKGAQNSSASLSDVKVGTVLRVTTEKSDGKLLSVLIMGEPSNR